MSKHNPLSGFPEIASPRGRRGYPGSSPAGSWHKRASCAEVKTPDLRPAPEALIAFRGTSGADGSRQRIRTTMPITWLAAVAGEKAA